MSPLALGIPLALPSLAVATRAAAGGLSLLQSLVTPSAKQTPAANVNSSLSDLQSSMAEEIRRAGFGASLPLDVANNGQGGISVLSDSPQRSAIEQRLNAQPFIAQQFRALAQRAGAMFRMTIPAAAGFDALA